MSKSLFENSLTKLNGSNYTTWKFSIQTVLTARELWSFCKTRDSTPGSAVKNAEAKAIIFNSMDDKQKARIGNCETAHDLWVKLQDTFEGSESTRRAKALHALMTIKCKKGEAINEFCSRFEAALTELQSTGHEVDNSMSLFTFKNALPAALYEKADTWEMCQKAAKIADLITLMRNREPKDEESSVALFVREKSGGSSKPRANKEKAKDRIIGPCNHCKETGHLWRQCPKKKQDDKRKKAFAEKMKGKEASKPKGTDYAYVAMFKGDAGKADQEVPTSSSSSSHLGSSTTTFWIIDSGATRSMTNQLSWLADYTPYATPHEIMVGDGKSIWAYGVGSLKIQNPDFKVEIENVLYSPALSVNLLSVKQLMKIGFDVLFKDGGVRIRSRDGDELSGQTTGDGLLEVMLKLEITKRKDGHDSAYLAVSLDDWHRRFGHVNHAVIKAMAKSKAVSGLNLSNNEVSECVSCAVSKIHRTSHPSRMQKFSNKDMQILHFDTCGPVDPVSLGGNKYFVLATDQNSGFRFIKFVEYKSEIPAMVREIIAEAKLYSGRSTDMVVCDNGTEFVNKNLKRFFREKMIALETSSPYTPQQNGLAERTNRTIIESVRALLTDSKMDNRLWTEAAVLSVYVSNRTVSKGMDKTKYEVFTGIKPDVSHLRTFGQYVVVLTPKQFRESKWSPAGKIVRFVGYTSRSNTYRLFDETAKRIVISCDVKFLVGTHASYNESTKEEVCTISWAPSDSKGNRRLSENAEPESIDRNKSSTSNDTDLYSPIVNTGDIGGGQSFEDDSLETEIYDPEEDSSRLLPSTPNVTGRVLDPVLKDKNPKNRWRNRINDKIHQEILQVTGHRGVTTRSHFKDLKNAQPLFADSHNETSSENASNVSPPLDTIREARESQGEEGAEDGDQDGDNTHFYETIMDLDESHQSEENDVLDSQDSVDRALFAIEDEPLTVKDALDGSEREKWQAAMDREMNSLEQNGTWVLEDRPSGVKPVKCKWVFKRKLAPDGSAGEYKARLVAKGYSQIPGIDFKETFAPVAQMNTVRSLFAVANQLDMEIAQFDVKTAFLYGDLDETIYMDYPEGYSNPNNRVCRLVKSLYGLKQSPRQWNLKFKEFLTKFRLKQSIHDRCLYYNQDKTVFVAIYVDDGLIVSKYPNQAKQLLRYLEKHLEIKHLPCVSYLGFQVKRKREERELVLHQAQYIERVLERYNMANCKPSSTPEEVGQCNFADSPKLTAEYPFKEAIGSLLYLVTCTRPDIAHAVSIASRTSEPTMAHWLRIKRILRYLAGTKEIGLRFLWEDNAKLYGYCDADYANDVETRRSTSGYGIFYGNSLVAWRCQRQPIVSLSTTEAEYISGCELVKDLLPIREMFVELGWMKKEPVKVFIDNLSAVHIAKDTGGQQRTKHIDVRQKWLSEQHESKKIEVNFIPGDKQLADMLTKPLHKTKFQLNRNLLMSTVSYIIMLLTLLVGLGLAFNFDPVSPVTYLPAEVPYFRGVMVLRSNNTEVNPCKAFFRNISSKAEWNSKLIEMCNRTFVSKTLSIMTECRDRIPTDIMVRRLYQVGEISREKRALPFIVLGGIAVFTGLNTMGTSYAIHRTYENTENIEKVNLELHEIKKLMTDSVNVLNEVKNSAHDLANTDLVILEQLAFMKEDQEAWKKANYLMSAVITHLDERADLLRYINYELKDGRFSSFLNHYSNKQLWIEPSARWSSIGLSRRYLDSNGNFILQMDGQIPLADTRVRVMKAAAFKFWNRTEKGDFCKIRYSGPRYILANTSANCYDDLDSNQVIDDSVMGVTCAVKDQTIKPLRLFVAQECSKVPNISEKDEQIIDVQNEMHIYCPNSSIEIRGTNYTCPDHVFKLAKTESFILPRHRYQAVELSNVVINSVDHQIAEDIKNQLDTNVKIRVANMTKLDATFERYSRFVSSIAGREIKLSKPAWVSEVLLSLFAAVANVLKGAWSWIQQGVLIGLALMFIAVIAMFLPLLITSLKMVYWPVKQAMFMLRRESKKGYKKLRSQRRHWDDLYVRRDPDLEEGHSD